MPAITFRDVTKVFPSADGGDKRKAAVRDVSLEVDEGKFVVLLGPSGCGKTTLMRMVNRLIEPTSGQIFVGDREIHDLQVTELRRHIGYVIQQVGLFPHMNVAQNISVVPKLLGWDRARIGSRVDELLALVDLPPAEYRKRYPRQLSGGQQQRVGIARAMAADPSVMLMDEPFGAIDAITRHDLQNELIAIQRKVVKTVIFVTHDVEEALRLADKIAVMRAGEVVQYDSPLNLLAHPADDFVRALLGTEDVFRQLSLRRAESLVEPGETQELGDVPTISVDTDLRSALSLLIATGADRAIVLNDGTPLGVVTLQHVLNEATRDAQDSKPEHKAARLPQ